MCGISATVRSCTKRWTALLQSLARRRRASRSRGPWPGSITPGSCWMAGPPARVRRRLRVSRDVLLPGRGDGGARAGQIARGKGDRSRPAGARRRRRLARPRHRHAECARRSVLAPPPAPRDRAAAKRRRFRSGRYPPRRDGRRRRRLRAVSARAETARAALHRARTQPGIAEARRDAVLPPGRQPPAKWCRGRTSC